MHKGDYQTPLATKSLVSAAPDPKFVVHQLTAIVLILEMDFPAVDRWEREAVTIDCPHQPALPAKMTVEPGRFGFEVA